MSAEGKGILNTIDGKQIANNSIGYSQLERK